MNDSNRRFFYCYSTSLFKHIQSQNVPYNCKGLHVVTQNLFYQFDYTEELVKALKSYNKE